MGHFAIWWAFPLWHTILFLVICEEGTPKLALDFSVVSCLEKVGDLEVILHPQPPQSLLLEAGRAFANAFLSETL